MARSDALDEYRSKRDFSVTPEPSPRRGRAGNRDKLLSFVVQKHDATRLHYDFRLEWKGVLKSWAVTRGPSLDPAEKRLAVMTEDHPLDYGTFEGTIPKGAYGGGTVMLWDRGTWEPLHDPEEGLREGKLHFNLKGERMHGGWALVRMRRKASDKRDNWLLIKERDSEADDEGENLLDRFTTSISTGRSMAEIAKGVEGPAAAEPRRRKGAMPRFRGPQLATLVDMPPDGEEWLHEVKFDGYRLLAAVGKGGVRLSTRSGLDWTTTFPDVAKAIAALDCDTALIDGEVVAADIDAGSSAFSALQRAIANGGPFRFYAFDLLELDGKDIASKPLAARKEHLASLLGRSRTGSILQYSEHVEGSGDHVFRKLCTSGQEGLVSKRADQPYRSGRGRSWLKTKCVRRQEFLVGGFSPSQRRGRPFASLLVGTMEDGKLIYRGRVGSGFSADALDELASRLGSLRRKTPPFDTVPPQIARSAEWVKPSLIVEIDFAELTEDGVLRHARFLGTRADKPAGEVTLEKAQMASASQSEKKSSRAAKPKHAGPAPADNEVIGVAISSPDREVFPGQHISKLDIARYYAIAADRMLVDLAGRPASLLRCPDGLSARCFFQKHAGEGFPEAIRRFPVKESSGETEEYMSIDTADALVSAVQMGTIEFHIWGARRDRLDRPDRLVFDLDPGPGVSFRTVTEAAATIRDELEQAGLRSVPMVTGGKGVHVVAPIERRSEWSVVKDFARGYAEGLARRHPDTFIATMSKQKRKGVIFVDWLRNERGATAVCPYSIRARDGAAVAAPLTWKELPGLSGADAFGIRDMLDRIGEPDPWADARKWRQKLPSSIPGEG